MKITKYEHACFTVELDGTMLVVDPGEFTNMPNIPESVVAIVVTHEHQDHFEPHMLAAIYDKNPESVLVSLESITSKIPDHISRTVLPGDNVHIGPFNLAFFGGKHAEIHSSIPLIDNIGVMINDELYFPGDSFEAPHKPISLLAPPASGPWFKTSDAVDFMLEVKPRNVFATHNIHNSAPGQALFDRIVGGFAERAGITYTPLSVGESIEL